MTASDKMTIASGNKHENTSMTGWTRRILRGSVGRPEVESNTGVLSVALTLYVTRL